MYGYGVRNRQQFDDPALLAMEKLIADEQRAKR